MVGLLDKAPLRYGKGHGNRLSLGPQEEAGQGQTVLSDMTLDTSSVPNPSEPSI